MRLKKKFLTFGQAKRVVLQHNISSSGMYRLKYKKIFGLPVDPKHIYKHNWVDWHDFLGKGSKFPSLDEARKIVQSLGIKTIVEYRALKEIRKKYKLPWRAHKIYKDKGWVDWNDFFGISKKVMDFEKARAIVKKIDITNSFEWLVSKKKLRKNIRGIPSNPHIVYKGKGWVSWEHFLGKGSKFTTYDEARKIVQTWGIRSIAQYRRITPADRKKFKLPWYASEIYKDEGWISWNHFFGKDK
jgi:hypothetical protein